MIPKEKIKKGFNTVESKMIDSQEKLIKKISREDAEFEFKQTIGSWERSTDSEKLEKNGLCPFFQTDFDGTGLFLKAGDNRVWTCSFDNQMRRFYPVSLDTLESAILIYIADSTKITDAMYSERLSSLNKVTPYTVLSEQEK